MKVKFSRCNSSDLASLPIVDGQLTYVKDTGENYLDAGVQRTKITDIVFLDKEADFAKITNPLTTKLYYAKDTNNLMYYMGEGTTVSINATDPEDVPFEDERMTADNVNEALKELKTDILANTTAIGSNTQNITTNTSDISSLQQTVAGILTKDTEQDGRLDDIDTDITNIKADITELQDTTELDNELDGIKTRLTSVEGVNTTQGTAITNIQTKDTQQDGRLDSIEAKDTEQDGRLDTAEEDIDTLKEAVTTLSQTDETILETIGNIQTKDTTQDGKLTTLEGNMSTAQGNISTLQTNVEDINTEIEGLKSKDTGIETDIAGLKQKDIELTSSIGTEHTKNEAQDSRLTALETDNTTNKSDISSIKETNTTQQSAITALQNKDTSLDSDISALQTKDTELEEDIEGLDTRLTTAEGNITTNAGNIETNTSDITSLKTKMTTAEGNISTNTSDISTLDTRVTTVKGELEEAIGDNTEAIEENASAIEGLDGRLTTAEGTITQNTTDIATKQNITDNTLQTTAKTVVGSINELKGRVDALHNYDDSGVTTDIVDLQAEVATKFDASEATPLIKDVQYDSTTATFTFVPYSGNNIVVDLPLESTVKTGRYDAATESLILVLVSDDEISIPVSALIDIYTGVTGSKIAIDVSSDNEISATVVTGSIAETDLTSEVQTKLNRTYDLTPYATISYVDTELGKKVDKVTGYGLISDTERQRLANVDNYDDTAITGRVSTLESDNTTNKSNISSLQTNKVDKVEGKQLSTNDFTDTLKTKLEGLENYTLEQATATKLGGIKVGTNLSIDNNGVLSATDTTYSNMTGATSTTDGTSGLVPKPTKGNEEKYLKADGTWSTPTDTTYSKATTEADGLMSKEDKTKLNGLSNYDDTAVKGRLDAVEGDVATNTADIETIKGTLETKVDKITGKGLSTEDYTTAEKTKLAGLSNYDDTTVKSDISTLQTNLGTLETTVSGHTTTLSKKVDKVDGKQLSTNDFTTAYRNKLEGLSNYDDTVVKSDISDLQDDIAQAKEDIITNAGNIETNAENITALQQSVQTNATNIDKKVDKVTGKGLSTNDFTDSLKTKLEGIDTGANKYVLPIAGSDRLGGIKVGTNLSIDSEGVLSATDTNTTYSTMTGASENTDGASGLVPKPLKGNQGKYLRADGTWSTPTNTTYNEATTTTAGLMSASDKDKLNNIANNANNYVLPKATATTLGGVTIGENIELNDGEISVDFSKVTVDTMTGATSSKAGTSGKVPAPAAGKQDSFLRGDGTWVVPTDTTYTTATTTKDGLMSSSDKTKLNGIAENANNYVHPTTSGNKHIPAGGSSGQILRWSADGTAVWGEDVNTTYNEATTDTAGLMSASDKTKLNGIEAGANKYSLPTAGSTLGGVKTTSTVTSTAGLTASPIIGGVVYYKDTNTTYENATTSTAGLMSASDKTKLNGLSNYDDSSVTSRLDDLESDNTTNKSNIAGNTAALDTKVDKVTGKGLSTNDYTTTEKNKLSGVATGATKVEASTTNGNIKINGTETTVYTKPALTKSEVTTALGYTPPTQDTTYSDMGGASASAAGTHGLVPAPAKGDQNKFLSGAGTWQNVSTENTTYSLTQDSTNGHKITLTPSTGEAQTITIPDNNTTYGLSLSGNTVSLVEGGTTKQVTVPDNNTTYTLTQDATDGHKLTFTPSTGTATTITIPDNNTTYNAATQSVSGLMSAADKKKLDGIAEGATKTTDTNTTYSISKSGSTITLTGSDGTTTTVTDSDTTYSTMTGASSSNDGASGLVPKPTKGNQGKYLKADGTWDTPTNTNTTYTLTQDATDGHKITLTPSSGTATTITIPDNNTTYTLSSITGTLAVSKGGTGATTLASGQALIGNGTGAVTTKAIDTTSGGTSGSSSLITSGAVYSGLSGKISTSEKGVANGVATLGSDGKVPQAQLPSYVDDVLEYAGKSSFPTTGETGKIYVDTSTNKTYRWSGTDYVDIKGDLALGTTSSTAFRGDYGNTAYTHATDSSKLTTATASGLYKVASTASGHIASLTAVTKADITALGIPGSDTNTWTAFVGATSSSDGTAGYVPKAGTGNQNKFFRGDGTWQTPANDNTTYTFATGDNNGTIKVTPLGGSAQNVSVKGLGDLAYKSSLSASEVGALASTTKYAASSSAGGDASKAVQLTTARAIDGVNFNGTTAISHYGTCGTTAGTADKVVSCANFTLTTGSRIIVKFTTTNTAAVANLTLNVNETGAKPIKYRGANLPAVGTLTANRVYEFIYDGTNYELVGDIDTNTNTWNKVSTTQDGYVTKLPGNTTTFLRGDGTWAATPNDNTNYYPTTWTWTGGTTSGPTASLSGSGMSAVSVAAIPAADGTTASGIVTTGNQTFGGVKTFSSTPKLSTNTITTSDGNTVTIPNATATLATTSTSQALTNKTYNGLTLTAAATGFTIKGGTTSKTLTVNSDMTLAAAAAKGVDTSISAASTSTNLPTSAAVAAFVEGKGYKTTDNNTTYTFGTGSTNGTISVTPSGGTASDVAVKGLSDLAYISKGTSTTTYLRNDGTWATPTNSNTVPSAYCNTAAATAAKTATCTDYALLAKSYLHVLIKTANTAQNALTLNVNSKGAKPIYINGTISSASNYTLPAGTYLVYYDGTNYYFRTDGKITGDITGNAATVNGLTVQTAVPANAKFTDTDTTYSAGTGLSLSSTTFSLATSGVTAGSAGPTAAVTGSEGTTVAIPRITVDEYGRVTGLTSYNLTNKNTTYSAATTSANGLMSSTDKTKLNGIQEGATATSITADLTSGTKIGTITINGTATDLYCQTNTNTDTKVTVSNTNPTTGTWYYPTSYTSTSGTGGVIANDGLRHYSLQGTASAAGRTIMQLGNATATGTAGNKYGELRIYAEKAGFATLKATASATAEAVHYLPTTGGTLLNTGTTSISNAATSGTKVADLKINGTTTTLYAPTNTNTTYTLTQDATDGHKITLTPSSGNATTITIPDNNTTYESKAAASGGTAVSLVTTGEKYTWNNKSSLAIGTTATTAAAGNHTHTTSLATDTGTSSITLASAGKYKLTAGGNSVIFTMPTSTNLSIGTTSTTAAAGNHTHTTSLATDTGTSSITLASAGKYKLTAGGSSVIFTMPTIPTDTDTLNTAGSTASTSKLFLVGATSQAANPQTYSNANVYVSSNHLYSNNKQVVNLSDTQALTNKTYNGYTLAAACAKGVDTSMTKTSTSTNVPTTAAVASLVSSLSGCTTTATSLTCTLPDNL